MFSNHVVLRLYLILGLILVATIYAPACSAASPSLQPLEEPNDAFVPRHAEPAPLPNPSLPPKTPKPKTTFLGATVALAKKIIEHLEIDIEAGNPPAIGGDDDFPDEYIYPPNAGAKIDKTKRPSPGAVANQKCAGEYCLTAQDQKCVHMAGRKYQPAWFTCCAKGKFADFHGNCCFKKLSDKQGHHSCP